MLAFSLSFWFLLMKICVCPISTITSILHAWFTCSFIHQSIYRASVCDRYCFKCWEYIYEQIKIKYMVFHFSHVIQQKFLANMKGGILGNFRVLLVIWCNQTLMVVDSPKRSPAEHTDQAKTKHVSLKWRRMLLLNLELF